MAVLFTAGLKGPSEQRVIILNRTRLSHARVKSHRNWVREEEEEEEEEGGGGW